MSAGNLECYLSAVGNANYPAGMFSQSIAASVLEPGKRSVQGRAGGAGNRVPTSRDTSSAPLADAMYVQVMSEIHAPAIAGWIGGADALRWHVASRCQ